MAKHGAATDTVPQTAQRESTSNSTPKKTETPAAIPNSTFITMALTMSWQLALVVLAPIIGGHMLDLHYGKAPLLTLAGLVVAVIGVFGVLARTVSEANHQVEALKPKDKQ